MKAARAGIVFAAALAAALAMAGCAGTVPPGVLAVPTATPTAVPPRAGSPAAAQLDAVGNEADVLAAVPPRAGTPALAQAVVRTGVPEGWLNLRAGPGVAYPVAGLAREGQRVLVVRGQARDGWLMLASGAWARAEYLEVLP